MEWNGMIPKHYRISENITLDLECQKSTGTVNKNTSQHNPSVIMKLWIVSGLSMFSDFPISICSVSVCFITRENFFFFPPCYIISNHFHHLSYLCRLGASQQNLVLLCKGDLFQMKFRGLKTI